MIVLTISDRKKPTVYQTPSTTHYQTPMPVSSNLEIFNEVQRKLRIVEKLFKEFPHKVGDVVDSLKFKDNKDGKSYVVDFIVLSHKDSEFEGEKVRCPSTSNTTVSSVSSPSPILDRIMFGQAINLAFDFKGKYYDYSGEDEFISSAFDLADKIYVEYSKRVRR